MLMRRMNHQTTSKERLSATLKNQISRISMIHQQSKKTKMTTKTKKIQIRRKHRQQPRMTTRRKMTLRARRSKQRSKK